MADERDPRDPPIDPELLAAFLEGRVTPDERATVLSLLARSREARELVAEATALLQDELEQPASPRLGTESSPRRQAAWWRQWRIALPAAAVVALIAFFRPGTSRPEALRTSQVPGLVGASTPEREVLVDGPTSWNRSRGGAATDADPEVSFRVGYRMVDLAVALSLEEASAAATVGAEVTALLRPLPLAGSGIAVVRALLEPPAVSDPEARARLLDLADRELEDLLDPAWLLLGRWTAGAATATANGEVTGRGFLDSPASRDALARLVQLDWPPAIANPLATLVEASATGSSDFPALLSAVGSLVEAGGR